MEMLLLATLILSAGLYDDLRTCKVRNSLVVGLFAVTLLATLFFRGFAGSMPGAAAMLLALVATIPLFATGILGGGDVKLFAVFSLALDPLSMFWTLMYSILWAGVFGLTRAALQKQLLMLVRNTYRIASRQKIQMQEIQKIPYTFALLLGWFTQLTFMRIGGLV